jgi:hypothetical protein
VTGQVKGDTLIILGNAQRQAHWFDEAVIACQDAAAIFCQTGDEHNERIALEHWKQPRPRSRPETDFPGTTSHWASGWFQRTRWSAMVSAYGVCVL